MKSPKSIEKHQKDYKAAAWEQYTLLELGAWVHLFAKRAGHRSEPDKRAKDILDARNYLAMMSSFLDAVESGEAKPQ